MPQPLDNVLAVAQANMHLSLKLAETWRESGQKLMELGGRGVSEIADEARLALTKVSADKGGMPPASVTGHWQDVIAEAETVRIVTAQQIDAALQDWQESLSAAMSIEPGVSFETFVKPWLAMAKATTDLPTKAPQAKK
ncbi:hypothetical protein AWL63_23020 (plasmid) [Sphingomonas panacis]|uniref:Phasin domain-containing protein n=1 Tax=Sphingomonas panacis TaxID=1560345 RepID=A0A1B3ZI13_9SPHN|nr:hypothetical protein [Sphingomonas panacis]AOH87064.1 hypothetical protein AWL63_23020 [Sphingomonas panacis]